MERCYSNTPFCLLLFLIAVQQYWYLVYTNDSWLMYQVYKVKFIHFLFVFFALCDEVKCAE